jgi:hypothetical protein
MNRASEALHKGHGATLSFSDSTEIASAAAQRRKRGPHKDVKNIPHRMRVRGSVGEFTSMASASDEQMGA